MSRPHAEPFRILVVCEGNVCRSPLAAALLRDALARDDNATAIATATASAGTRALVASPAHPDTVTIADRLGVGADTRAHVARQIDGALAAGADLIVTATQQQRAEIAQLEPRALRRAFTLREFAHVLASLDLAEITDELSAQGGRVPDAAGRLRALVSFAGAMRGAVPPLAPEEFDVVDPYRRGMEVHELAAAQITAAVGAIAEVLRRSV